MPLTVTVPASGASSAGEGMLIRHALPFAGFTVVFPSFVEMSRSPSGMARTNSASCWQEVNALPSSLPSTWRLP